ncbi:cation-translocating P-type ATPase [Thiobacillus sp. 0-1251]|uniref:heavy metal translocating P-type ATPase n=1 Tax=Thiobacillus sp. 0-1251 TaxID=1895858 RepID=UPI000959E7BF|nr:cation-translocating P-type ATPase [Thiobacillus sp. 0-1251]OJY54865.1 MAG: copper-translocating P-type ATPase [Thiobacillus sp. 0-1251]
MNTAKIPEGAPRYWSEEPSTRPDRARIRARIGGLHCSLCTGTIEKALGRQLGVDKVAVSLTHEQALIEYDPGIAHPEKLLQTLKDIGYTISDPRKLRPFEEEEAALVREGRRFIVAVGFSLASIALVANPVGIWSMLLAGVAFISLVAFLFVVLRPRGIVTALSGVAGISVLGAALYYLRLGGWLGEWTPWLTGTLALGLVFGVGRHILLMATQALKRGILNQHVLLETGAMAGIAGGIIGLAAHPANYPTAPFFAVAVLVTTYHIFSEWLSLIVKTRSSQAVKKLLDLQPDTARVVRDGGETEVPIEEVALGEHVRIRPGERIAVDGEVIEGHSAVDESFITGEPMPIEKTVGAKVVGGAINGTGTLVVRVTAIGEESFLQQVVRHVEDARALKPGLLHLVDRVLRVYTPTVLIIAALALVGWIVGSFLMTGHIDIQRAVFAGLSVLIMGYPCAVGISAPLSIVRGAGEAAERGILMRTGEAFQGYRLVTHVVLDKTGTLTEGRPRVGEIVPISSSEDEVLGVAAAAEAASEHPLAQAIVRAAFDRGLTPPSVERFQAIPGGGVTATITAAKVVVGSPAFVEEQGYDLGSLRTRVHVMEEAGQTVIAVAKGEKTLGLIALGDPLRADAAATVAGLRQKGITPILLTGDNERTARRVAREVGIDVVHAGVRPERKAEIVREIQQKGKVAMVGDGINDAPALMQADVGIAMGSGTDIAIESADIIIVGNRLASILTAHDISRRGYRKMVQNVVLAFSFNGIGIPVAATGLVYPVWAMAAMAGSVTAIFFNSLWGKASLFFDALTSVGRPLAIEGESARPGGGEGHSHHTATQGEPHA